tara:strand:+ start:97 stop:615 length:519 start_codon:yes stop_codon:yes gene_type:complete
MKFKRKKKKVPPAPEFKVKKGKIEQVTPDYKLKERIDDKFTDAYRMDNDALLKTGKVVIKKRTGAKYDPSKEEAMLKFNKENRKPNKEQKEISRNLRKKEVSKRRKRLKSIKGANISALERKQNKRGKSNIDPKAKAPIIKPKSDRQLDIERRKNKLKKKRESQRPVQRYMR